MDSNGRALGSSVGSGLEGYKLKSIQMRPHPSILDAGLWRLTLTWECSLVTPYR